MFSPPWSIDLLFKWGITTGVISGAGTAYPSRAPDVTPVLFEVHFALSLVFYVVFCRSLFV
jgi:hypothetical protein